MKPLVDSPRVATTTLRSALALAVGLAVTLSANAADILILDPTVQGGTGSQEYQAAIGLGYTVDLVSAATWSGLTAAQFAGYRAIVLGDKICTTSIAGTAAATANAPTWGPQVDGNVIIIGGDPSFHANFGPNPPGAFDQIQKGIAFAAADPTKTGAYITLSCYYVGAAPNTPVPMLDHISTGGFQVRGAFGCFDDAHIVASHPALNGLTDSDIAYWSCSIHEFFDAWPADFQVLAIGKVLTGPYTAQDGTVGWPYVIARGDDLTPLGCNETNLEIDPNCLTPDAAILGLQYDCTGPGGDIELTATVANLGTVSFSPGLPVRFYIGACEQTNLVGTALTTTNLDPGTSEQVSITVPAPGIGFTLYVCIEPDGWDECDLTNNCCCFTIEKSCDCIEPPADMVGWWPLDEQPPATVAKDTASSNDGSHVGTLGPDTALVNGSLVFSPLGWVQVPDHPSLDFGVDGFAVDTWLRYTGPGCCPPFLPMVDKREQIGTDVFGYQLYLESGYLGLQLGEGPSVLSFLSAGPMLDDGDWHNVGASVWRDPFGTVVEFTIDGQLSDSFFQVGPISSIDNAADLLIGAGHPINTSMSHFEGNLDEVEIFDAPQMSQTFKAIYDAREVGKCKKTCNVTSVATCCNGMATITLTLCNYTDNDCEMDWFATPGPGSPIPFGSFSPGGGLVTVPANDCIDIEIDVTCPLPPPDPNSTYVGTYCIEVSALDPATMEFTPFCKSCGTLKVPDPCPPPPPLCAFPCPAIAVAVGPLKPFEPGPIGWDISNIGSDVATFDYTVSAVPANDIPDREIISLDGLPPGEPVVRTVKIPPGAFQQITIIVEPQEHTPLRMHNIVLSLDLDGDGILEAASSGMLRTLPPDPPCPGDANGDNAVDLSDLAIVLAQFGQSGGGLTGDLDGDGNVNLSDLALVLANFGESCP